MQAAETREAKILRFEALRLQLAGTAPQEVPLQMIATGLPAIDGSVGGLSRGAIHEFSGSLASGSLFLGALLEAALASGTHLALVDGADSFEPNQWAPPLLRRILWIRCHSIREAIKATDLLLRDGNIPVVVLDFQTTREAALRRIPGTAWHRFARTLEISRTALVVLNGRPIAAGVRLRISDETEWPFAGLQQPRRELISSLRLSIQERGKREKKAIAWVSYVCGHLDTLFPLAGGTTLA